MSMLIPLAVAGVLTFPALSVQSPLADWPAPSLERRTSGSQKSIPESPSEPEKCTVTSVLFQPLAFAAGVAFALAVGAVLSIWKAALVTAAALLPARSAQLSEVTVIAVP